MLGKDGGGAAGAVQTQRPRRCHPAVPSAGDTGNSSSRAFHGSRGLPALPAPSIAPAPAGRPLCRPWRSVSPGRAVQGDAAPLPARSPHTPPLTAHPPATSRAGWGTNTLFLKIQEKRNLVRKMWPHSCNCLMYYKGERWAFSVEHYL